ncbi:class I SAM-dependent methyltransferase [Lysinibacillus sp. KU-BSD001]|uniref:class I SAM-dependent methyltransferase n=1 Tax=Lysinibacillus sp. KU-BSD001 TaxID=3141328 RepID=UPI0036E31BD1
MREKDYEQLLNISTTGFQYGVPKLIHYHSYEPTPYEALEQLFAAYELPSNAHVVDFGSGKGRVPIFLHHKLRIPTVGVEMDGIFFKEAQQNKNRYLQKAGKKLVPITFLNMLAEQYDIQRQDNVFFFFNPFSVQIFRKVVMNIYRSVEQYPREIHILLYYPSPEYLYYLQFETNLDLLKEVKLQGFKNPNERICVFTFNV